MKNNLGPHRLKIELVMNFVIIGAINIFQQNLKVFLFSICLTASLSGNILRSINILKMLWNL